MNRKHTTTWLLFQGHRGLQQQFHGGFRHNERQGLTAPRPDWTAFFPMYEDIAGEEKQETSLVSKTIRDNFSITTLKHLANRNVQCHPRSLLRRMIAGEKSSPGRRRKRDLPTKETLELLSFPWFIVEHKRSGYMPEDQRHIQAANAGACAIMMHESLSTIVSKGAAERTHSARRHHDYHRSGGLGLDRLFQPPRGGLSQKIRE